MKPSAQFLSPTALRILGALFTLRLEWSTVPEGVQLAALNLPGSTVSYLNIELRILGVRALLGHIRFY